MGALGARAVVRRGAAPDGGRVSAEPHPVQLLAFELSGRRLAVPVEDLNTVVRAVAIAPLPHAPPFVEGVIDLRGRIVAVIDLRRRFGLPTVPLALDQRFVVVRTPRRAVALRVDSVEAVVAAGPDAVERPDRVLPGARHAAGIARLADGVIVIQDLEALLSSEDEARLDVAREAVAAGVVDLELPITEIGPRLAALVTRGK